MWQCHKAESQPVSYCKRQIKYLLINNIHTLSIYVDKLKIVLYLEHEKINYFSYANNIHVTSTL